MKKCFASSEDCDIYSSQLGYKRLFKLHYKKETGYSLLHLVLRTILRNNDSEFKTTCQRNVAISINGINPSSQGEVIFSYYNFVK